MSSDRILDLLCFVCQKTIADGDEAMQRVVHDIDNLAETEMTRSWAWHVACDQRAQELMEDEDEFD